MVGQFENSLMPWRMPSSSSTLTVFTFSAPEAFRTWMARPENPHIGNCAVPFMKRTTGLSSTICLMRSCVSMTFSCDAVGDCVIWKVPEMIADFDAHGRTRPCTGASPSGGKDPAADPLDTGDVGQRAY